MMCPPPNRPRNLAEVFLMLIGQGVFDELFAKWSADQDSRDDWLDWVGA